MTEKVVGYLLIVTGLMVILLAALGGYGVLTGRNEPPKIVELSGVNLDLGSIYGSSGNGNLQAELISKDDINKSTNLILYLVFLGFFLNVGGRVAGIGTNLVRPIVVKGTREKTS